MGCFTEMANAAFRTNERGRTLYHAPKFLFRKGSVHAVPYIVAALVAGAVCGPTLRFAALPGIHFACTMALKRRQARMHARPAPP